MSNKSKQAEQAQKFLTLVVTNTQDLEAGLSASYSFDQDGGSVGSATSSSWLLKDKQAKVRATHFEISMVDGAFSLRDTHGACFINGATIAVGKNKLVRLNENDVIATGPYKLRAHFSDNIDEVMGQQHSLEQVFSGEENLMDVDLSEFNKPQASLADEHALDDPLAALDQYEGVGSITDTNDLVQDANDDGETQQSDYLLAKDQQWHGQEQTVHADSEHEISSAIVLKQAASTGEHAMDDKSLESLEQELSRDFGHFDKDSLDLDLDENNHLLTGPMLRGLGVSAGNPDNMVEMQAMSEEMGASLQAAIKGLLALHQQVEDSRYGVMNKNLQPIEDNPLRLGQSYQTTVKTLFNAERSAVHLSAPSAIEESLTLIKHHNEAVQQATIEALSQILGAFSPEVLMRRFSRYRRPGTAKPESEDAWSWKMYQSYYKELTSDRQKGFEKLFWEIFDQAYDKQLRQKQQEI